jgi:hypothetical protein
LAPLAKDYGFALKLYPVAASEMQNQSSPHNSELT